MGQSKVLLFANLTVNMGLFWEERPLGFRWSHKTPQYPDPFGPLYDTLGDRGLTAVNQSEFATGYQQTAFNIFAETSFVWPSYWSVDAFSGNNAKESWKYEYSVTPAYHGADLTAYFSVNTATPTEGIRHAFQKMLGSFIIKDSPVISIQDAKGGASDAIVPENTDGHILWPMWNSSLPIMMDLNTTGGSLSYRNVTEHLAYWLREDPGVVNHLRLANAYLWEGDGVNDVGFGGKSVRAYLSK
ncbi:CAZyme family CE10 [Penicillium frequentans]|uniref:CAZyme family CE10 n=1 Tax=Penicillium frequentans TaxID=3151616 RepID=A0AAD6D7V2_9EURO|nr:CAZyme family CE10 [Penicillium glabrum]